MRSALSAIVIAALLAGCASTGRGPTDALVAETDRPFLLSPSAGYPFSLGPTTLRRIDEAHRALATLGDGVPARTVAAELLARDPRLHPAIVLAAQADFFERRHELVMERLRPVVEELPEYDAAQLLLGRSAEKLGAVVEAIEAYSAVSRSSQAARDRAAELQPRAVEILALRVEDALARGVSSDAERELDRLRRLAPGSQRTLESEVAVAVAHGDRETELAALRELARMGVESRPQIERRAALELEGGDAAVGMRLLEDLAAEYPDDSDLQENLARARFVWRLELLPSEVRELATEPQLTRGDLATILFWLFPDVRYGRVESARIANDVLQHPHRDEIVRVINMGLMDIDPSLHSFEPYRPVLGVELLSSMLRLLERKQPPLDCLNGAGGRAPTSTPRVCKQAAACGLLEDEADCFPEATISGGDAMQLCREVQELLGVE